MELSPHTDKKIYWEHKLTELLNKDNQDGSTVHFEYERINQIDNIFKPKLTPRRMVPMTHTYALKVKTYNPKKDVMFLLVETTGKNEGTCAEDAYQELIRMRNQQGYSSYTLEWGKKNATSTGIQTSYFFAANEFEVLTKFYSDMGPENVVFYSLKINPIS
jgi:hypothetical protein